LLGSSLAGFTLVWYLTATTGSAIVLAIGMLIPVLPQFFLSTLMLALEDRGKRRIIMILADGTIAALSFALPDLFVLGIARVRYVYIILSVRILGGIIQLLAIWDLNDSVFKFQDYFLAKPPLSISTLCVEVVPATQYFLLQPYNNQNGRH
jgi:hypothetical protein